MKSFLFFVASREGSIYEVFEGSQLALNLNFVVLAYGRADSIWVEEV